MISRIRMAREVSGSFEISPDEAANFPRFGMPVKRFLGKQEISV